LAVNFLFLSQSTADFLQHLAKRCIPLSSDRIIRLGPIELEASVTHANAATFLYAAFFSISLVTVLNFLQAYIITQHLQIPESAQGAISGDLQVWNEVVSILLVLPLGIWSDRVGRRIILVVGLIVLGISYIWYPLVSSVTEMVAARLLHSVGGAGVTGMIGIIAADYARKNSRGKLVAAAGMLIGLGIAIVVKVIGALPDVFVNLGYDNVSSGTAASWIAAIICFVTAIVLQIGLKGSQPGAVTKELPSFGLFIRGMQAARDPRIAIAYASGFVSRADQSMVGLFLSLWALQAGIAQGLSASAALANATTPFLVAVIAGLCWAPVFGFLLDKMSELMGICIALGLGFVGYTCIGLIEDPLSISAYPAFAVLGLGQMSTLIGSQTLVAKVAEPAIRGSIIGAFGFWGAIGIVISSLIGGRLFDQVDPSAPFVMVGLLQGLLLAIAVYVLMRQKI
jgi:MFS family permease